MLKRYSAYLSCALIMLLGLSSCKQTSKPPQKQKQTKQTKAKQTKPSTQWPPNLSENPSFKLATDLTQSNYLVVLDGSGSMGNRKCTDGIATKMKVAKEALGHFVKAMNPAHNLGLITFNQNRIIEKLGLGTKNRDHFIEQVNGLFFGGETPLKSAIAMAVKRLTQQGSQQLGYGEYHLVIVTDGAASSQSEIPTHLVNQTLRASPIVFHTIGFCIGNNHSLNQPGRTLYTSANTPQELSESLKKVLAEAEDFSVGQFN